MSKIRIIVAAAVAIVLTSVMVGGVRAEVPEGFATKDTLLTQHMAVALTGEKIGENFLVEAADTSKSTKALGVVVSLADSLIATSSVQTAVFVADTGQAKVYVSDLNGAPKVGDLVGVSPLKGVLMKATDETEPSFGVALEDFNGESVQEIEVKDKNGQPLKTKVSLMSINVDVNPPLKSKSSSNDDWLESVATSLTGQELSSTRVLAILLVFITMMVVAGEIIYGIVSGSITAMGRNPLARKVITRQSARNSLYAAVILGLGTIIIVALIWF